MPRKSHAAIITFIEKPTIPGLPGRPEGPDIDEEDLTPPWGLEKPDRPGGRPPNPDLPGLPPGIHLPIPPTVDHPIAPVPPEGPGQPLPPGSLWPPTWLPVRPEFEKVIAAVFLYLPGEGWVWKWAVLDLTLPPGLPDIGLPVPPNRPGGRPPNPDRPEGPGEIPETQPPGCE